MIFKIFSASALLVPYPAPQPLPHIVCLLGNAQAKVTKAGHGGSCLISEPMQRVKQSGVFRTGLSWGLGGHLPAENSWAKARDISNKGKPTAMNLTMRSRGSSRCSPLRRGPLWSGSKASDSMYSAAACASDMVPGALGVQLRKGGPRTVVWGRQLQAAGFEQTVTAASASQRYVLGAGTGSLNNWPGPEPGIW